MSKQALLAQVPIFRGCSKRELTQIAALATRIACSSGEVLAQEGEAGDLFFMIERGEAEVSIGGRKVTVLKAGASFGEVALLDALPRSATVVATTPMVLYTVKAADFARFLDVTPSVTRKILSHVSERLRSVEAAPSYDKTNL